jgi:nucleoside-diphosphate-sugar epimerase
VHISTPSIYFDGTHRLGVKEDAVLPAVKVNCYAESKWQAERLVAHAAMQGLETLTLRPRALFGPGDTVLLPRLIQANARFGIPIMHSAAVLTDLSYVGNVADAVALALRAPKNCLGRVYNISNGEPVDLDAVLLQLFDALEIPLRRRRLPYALAHGLGCMSEGLASLTGREPTLSRYGVGVLSRSMTLDISRAQAYLDYTPQVSVQEGIARFASWWQEQRSA